MNIYYEVNAMVKSLNQKLKLLYLLKTLDEENTMMINEMIAELERYRITAELKTLRIGYCIAQIKDH